MDFMTANDWLVKIVDQIDVHYCHAESDHHCINKIANLFQTTDKRGTSLCLSNDPATLRATFATTLGLALDYQPRQGVLVVLLADCLIEIGMRLLATQSEPNYDNYTTGLLPDVMWPSITQAVGFLSDKPIYTLEQGNRDTDAVLDDISQFIETQAVDTIMVYAENHSEAESLAPYQLIAGLNNFDRQESVITQLFFLDNDANLENGTDPQHAGFYRTVTPFVALLKNNKGELNCQIFP